MTAVREALRFGAKALRGHRCKGADAAKDAELLLARATGLRREDFFVDPGRRVTPTQTRRYRTLLRRRAVHAPIAYLTGSAWFRGREFLVDRRTLIPRCATEHLVLAALAAAPDADAAFDIGTGSGCIAVSLAAALPTARVVAVDRSRRALRVARLNAKRLGVSPRVRFLRGDLLAPARRPLAHAARPLIVANLPYLPTRKVAALSPDILAYEPKSALDGGDDGLVPCRRMLDQLFLYRPNGGFMLFAEMLPEQYVRLMKMVRERFPAARMARVLNYSGVTVGLHAKA